VTLAERFVIDHDGWRVTEDRFRPALTPALESVFAVANGYLGVRGTPEEGAPAHETGLALNGFHETWPIVYPEDAYGLARTGQTIVQAPDSSVIRLFVDDEPFDLESARLLRFERSLDMRTAVLSRELEFETARGTRMLIRSRRLASLEHRHLVAFDYEVVALDGSVEIAISSELTIEEQDVASDDPRRAKAFGEKPLVPVAADADGTRALLQLETRNSGLRLACGIDHAVDCDAATSVESSALDDHAAVVVLADLEEGQSLRLSKFAAYHWGDRDQNGRLAARARRTLDRALRHGFDRVEAAQRRDVGEFWRRSDIEVEGAPEIQLAVRFNLFQLMQATARGEGHGVPAKGVTGRGYEGHYFWDTEVYVVPFLAHTNPQWAKQVLEFRVGMLDAARRRAREVGHAGALYPWRTISGEEASAWYAAGTAQYHINADIAYAMHQYNRVTGDLGFMLDQGAEVLVETARFWMELGYFDDRRDGRFSIMGVTGPDEYTTVVDNNAYTNLMAKENLEIATRITEWLQGADPEAYDALVASTGITCDEVEGWRRAAELMFVPRHEELGIVLQDERFLERKRWDFENTPAENYPLLLNYHPLELYRHQVIKQTDVVLATYLVGHHFSEEEKRRTFDYYDALTTGDSSLSACIQSVVASEVGYGDAALGYFLDALTVDLLDTHGNTADGIHIASCGGTWLALVAGFGGLRDSDGEVHFSPRLPDGWTRLRFRVQVRGQLIEVDMTPDGTDYTLIEGRGLLIFEGDTPIRLTPALGTDHVADLERVREVGGAGAAVGAGR
jgi:alpha,alpha-trehalose phosphorylase